MLSVSVEWNTLIRLNKHSELISYAECLGGMEHINKT